MPRPDIRNSVVMSAWTQQEQIDELRGKLHLKERDARAFFESSEEKKIKNERLIASLRAENKRKRVILAKSINGDEKVIHSVFQNRKEELLSMQRYTVEGAVKTMDQKVCEASKRRNTIKHEADIKRDRLKELQSTLRQMRLVNTQDFDLERKQVIRRLQNEMDKAGIKYEAARNITRRYEEIMTHMQEECRLYPARLNVLEEIFRDASTELDVLKLMNEKAVKSSDDTRRDLMKMEREMYQARRARDQQLTVTKKEVERRKEPTDRQERRAKVAYVTDTAGDTKAMKLQQEKEDRQEKILTLEDAFERIKSAIHVSNMDDIVYRVTNQDNTRHRILQQEQENLDAKERLMEEKTSLRVIFEDLKFTSQRQIAKGRKMVEDVQEYVKKEETSRDDCLTEMTVNEKLLLDLQSGIATLYEKLKEIRLKPPYHNFSKSDPVEDLANCQRKLEVLLTGLGLWKKTPELSPVNLNEHKLHTYLENKLPADNVRIRLETDDGSDIDDFHFDHDQDNDGLLSRDDIKRQGMDFLNSKLKPKKKKGRKVRTK
ncbi:outer dynein arm-docking complex subunit 3-like [Mytilus galloprovincialis]|uniref:outer dynein arm-docking complex subunit 3-like n=1 Tax=Mytilus galloprovincialis TaxID=29158 RepID=UPI003F7C4F80